MKIGSIEPNTPLLMVCCRLAQRPRLMRIKVTQATASAMISAHMPVCLLASMAGKRCLRKLQSMPGKTPYVNSALIPITSTSGSRASSKGMVRLASPLISASPTWPRGPVSLSSWSP
ncbi:hypothetical protein D3C72_1464010 [compost metagenome]